MGVQGRRKLQLSPIVVGKDNMSDHVTLVDKVLPGGKLRWAFVWMEEWKVFEHLEIGAVSEG